MGIANETAATNMQASLGAGIASISGNQQVTFTQYSKVTLSQDGYVFWVKGATAVYPGSLHYGTDIQQNEDETIAVNDVIFTSPNEITEFNAVAPQTVWIATYPADGGDILVAFSERGRFYEPAQVWHYQGHAVYPALQGQIVASSADLPSQPIVSNSLPIWLAQNETYPVYPSFLVPENAAPPYIVAHIEPRDTEPLGGFPMLVPPGVPEQPGNPATLYDWPSSQLMRDNVRLTLYGLNNQQAIQFLFQLMELSLDDDTFGFCNSPAIRDEKRTQSEITAIAMKKIIEIQASYYLSTADALARRYILSASVSTTIGA